MYKWINEKETNRYVLFIDDMIAGTLYFKDGKSDHDLFVSNLIQPSNDIPIYIIEGFNINEVKENAIIKVKEILKNRIKTYQDFIKECEDTLNKLEMEKQYYNEDLYN